MITVQGLASSAYQADDKCIPHQHCSDDVRYTRASSELAWTAARMDVFKGYVAGWLVRDSHTSFFVLIYRSTISARLNPAFSCGMLGSVRFLPGLPRGLQTTRHFPTE